MKKKNQKSESSSFQFHYHVPVKVSQISTSEILHKNCFYEIKRIKKSKHPLQLFMMIFSRFNAPENQNFNIILRTIQIFLMTQDQINECDVINFLNFLDFKLFIQDQLKTCDALLLSSLFSLKPNLRKIILKTIVILNNPSELLFPLISNNEFKSNLDYASVFSFPFKQSVNVDPNHLKKIFDFVIENKIIVNQEIIQSFNTNIPSLNNSKTFSKNFVIQNQEPIHYSDEQDLHLRESEPLIIDYELNYSDICQKSIEFLNAASYNFSSILLQKYRRIRPAGNSFYISGSTNSKLQCLTKHCNIRQIDQFTIKQDGVFQSHIIFFMAIFMIIFIIVIIYWNTLIFVI